MKILTFDTSLNKTYITYGKNESVLINKAICSDEEKYHSVYLVPEIINILKTQNITMQDIDVIGINEGPGSFTGIRICTVIARVAAQQTGAKVVPVPSLEILSKINNSEKDTVVLLDARKNKAYLAKYSSDGAELIAPKIVGYDEIKAVIGNEQAFIISDKSMQEKLKDENIMTLNYEEKDYPLGEFLYKITLNKLKTDNDFHWAKAKPLYLQPPSITLPKKAGA